MPEPATVRARWAVLSKPPADGGDYRVLACSAGPAGFREFEGFVRPMMFGTPLQWSVAGEPGENLPWISYGFSGDGRRSHRWVSIAVTDWSVGGPATWDSAGRRPVVTRYFDVRFEDLARHRAGLTTLWRAVRPVVLPPGSAAVGEDAAAAAEEPAAAPEQVALRFDTEPLPRLAGLLDEEVDFGWAAATAAAALTVPIDLVARTSRYALTRIETMDAVLALLPYGYRAQLTAATWAPEPRAAHPRLCYTSASGSSARLTVREGTAPKPPSETARAHLARLLMLRDRVGTLGCLQELASVVEPASLPFGGGSDGPRARFGRTGEG
ncbi:hypothetical protein ABZ721_14255 [Streptomyces sp. NPDC006733]|uniref:hypothetical protein n=1 Tax=Streptomyces sp. NPDC006733 TaxID=3155460 RepID=UPI0033CFD4BC